MLFTLIHLLGAILAIAPVLQAHMILQSPAPMGSPNNSPLSPDGGDFPCKIAAGASSSGGEVTEFKVGEQQTLSFSGTAVHGGGSCQLAVSLDKEPSKQSKFKVIYSIEGGCPGVNGPSTFPFEVPKELPNGEAVFAWTWMNKIGNREFYMNCARIKVTGGTDDKAAFEGLPDMAVANIQGQGDCKTTEGSDYTFEDPGKYVTQIGSGPFVPLCGGQGSGSPSQPANPGMPSTAAPAVPSQTPNNGQYTQASAAPSAPIVSSQPAVAPSNGPSPNEPQVTSTVRTMITVTAPSAGQPSGAAPSAQPSQAPTGGVSGISSAAPIPAPSSQPSEAPTPGGAGGSRSCSADGEIVCNGDSQFGICSHGQVTWQPVAAGTKCQGGKIAKRHDFTHRNQRTAI